MGVSMLFGACRLRTLETVAYAHQRSKQVILSQKYINTLERKIGVSIHLLAEMAKLEHDLFGGICENADLQHRDTREKLSDPQRLRSFILSKADTYREQMSEDYQSLKA